MATVAVTCIKNGRADSFGNPLFAGVYYPAIEIETAKSLVASGFATVSNSSVFVDDPFAGTDQLNDYRIARTLLLEQQPNSAKGAFYSEQQAILEQPIRVFILGDSIAMRQFQSLSGASVTVSGASVQINQSGANAVVGSYCRIIQQANATLNRDVLITASSAASFTVLYPFDCTGLFSGTVSFALYCQQANAGWLNYALGLLAKQGKAPDMVRNCGNGGDTTAQVLARISSELAPLAQPGDIVIEMSGINGIEVVSTTSIIANKKAIYDALLALGCVVHAGTITQAQSSAKWSSPAAALAQIATINGYIRSRCLTEANMTCFDGFAAFGGGDYATAGLVETNGIHPLVAGAATLAARYVSDCGSAFRKSTKYRWLSTADNYVDATSKNLLTNSEFAGATGTTPPTDYSATGSGTKTYTLAAHPDGRTNDLQIDLSHSASTILTLTQAITARVAVGDRLVFGVEQETVTVAEGESVRAYIEIVAGGETYRHMIGLSGFSYGSGGRIPPAGSRYLFELSSDNNTLNAGVVIPPNTTSVSFILQVRLGASGSTSVKLGRPYCYKVAA